jgi:hypothetical protein
LRTHAIRLALCEPAPAEAPVGSEVTATLRASCPEGCDLRGLPLTIAAPDGTAATYDLAQFADGMNETAPVALRIPGYVGTHSWAVSRPAHEDGGRSSIQRPRCRSRSRPGRIRRALRSGRSRSRWWRVSASR